MNEVIKNIIRCVADNDVQKAKLYIKELLDKETSQSNRAFVNQIKLKLESSTANFLELPHDIRGILKMEDVSVSFNEGRYYLSPSEAEVFESIAKTKLAVDRLAAMGLRYVNSTLLYGESGTGKTSFGRYVAHKLGLPFAYLNFSECITSHLGGTGKNISKVFDYIKNQQCVFMLDEIDAIGLSRNSVNDVGELSRIVIGLMQAFDGLSSDVIVLAATNRMDILDAALLRRFTIKHEVKRLSRKTAVSFIKRFISSIDIDANGTDIMAYSKTCSELQSELTNDIISKIIVAVQNNEPLRLFTEAQ